MNIIKLQPTPALPKQREGKLNKSTLLSKAVSGFRKKDKSLPSKIGTPQSTLPLAQNINGQKNHTDLFQPLCLVPEV